VCARACVCVLDVDTSVCQSTLFSLRSSRLCPDGSSVALLSVYVAAVALGLTSTVTVTRAAGRTSEMAGTRRTENPSADR